MTSAAALLRFGWGLRVLDGRVADVAPNETLRARFPKAEVLDVRDLLLMPGFVNAHMHSYGILSHGMPPHGIQPAFYELLADFWWPRVEDQLDRSMVEASMALACYRMIRAGFTSFCDVLEAPNAPEGILEAEAAVVRGAGLRAVLMTEASERISRERGEKLLDENAGFVEAHRNDPLIRGMLCIHTSFSCSESFVTYARRMMDDLNCGLHLHLSESIYEPTACVTRYGVRPVMWYDRLGLWSDSVLVSQAVAVDEAEIEILSERGVSVAHMPMSNCEVGGGVAPVPAMIRRGLRPGLGTDGSFNDPFEVMRAAFLIHKGVLQDRLTMPAETVLEMGTAWGAQAIGFSEVGSLDAGRPADLIGVALDLDTPLNAVNAPDQVALYRDVRDVRMSMVNGDLLMKDGVVLSLDSEKVRRQAREQAQRLWEKA
jgi:5-methylthioadenosine/S-adenosylhomocysteine deaminase